MRSILFSMIVCLLLVQAGQADLLPPNHKPVSHVLRIVNIKDYPDYVFFVYPRDLPRNRPGNSSVRVDDSGQVDFAANPLARRTGAFLYAIPRKLFKDIKQPPQEEWFEKPADGVLKSERLVNQIRIVPKSDPRKQIITRYRIEIKDGLKTTLLPEEKPAREEEEEAANVAARSRWMIGWGIGSCAVISGLGLLFVRWRRRPAAN